MKQIKSDWWVKDIKIDQTGNEANWLNIQIKQNDERSFAWHVSKNESMEIAHGTAVSLKQAEYFADQVAKNYLSNGVGGYAPRGGIF